MKNFLPVVEFWDAKKKHQKKTKIAVALSGGVDSSVVLAMLREKGYEVFGMYFKTYKPDGNREKCKKEGSDAKKVCEHLGVPFYAIDLQEEYKKEVFEYMIESYKKGNTPNPDIFCNKYIKFGHFIKHAQKKGAHFVATGHYAQHAQKKNWEWKNILKKMLPLKKAESNNQISKQKDFLLKAIDQNKDQTYFLSQISSSTLKFSLFPLGGYEKKDVRKMAEKYRLFTATKKDSQGICFMQKEVKMKDFLGEYIESKKGDILNNEGEVVGEHDGSIFFTIGQRQGFEVFPHKKSPNQKKLFVIDKDQEKNTITVGEKKHLDGAKGLLEKKEIYISDINYLGKNIVEGKKYQGRIRHRGNLIDCVVEKNLEEKEKELKNEYVDISDSKEMWKVIFTEPQKAVASGQFLALYDGDICLGGGEIL